MFDNLSDKLDKAFHMVTENYWVNVAETLKEVRRACLTPMLILKLPKILPLK
jgi:hypothetical protein